MKIKIAIFYSFSSVSQPKICSSLSEPTLRSFSRHENKTSASHARVCYVRTALVRAMERLLSPDRPPYAPGGRPGTAAGHARPVAAGQGHAATAHAQGRHQLAGRAVHRR